jgi:hypothetical protein
MKLGSFLKPFNGEDGASMGLGCKDQTRQYRLAVKIDCAGATFPLATTLFGAAQIESLPEDINQPLPRADGQFIPITVDVYLNVDLCQ